MNTILFTKSDDLVVKTCYVADSQEFAVVLEYPDGTQQVVETFKSVMFLIEFHNFWCRFTGVLEDTTTPAEVNKHLKAS
jgi:hypothetical protein